METISNQASVSFSYEGSSSTRTSYSNTVTSNVRDQYQIEVEKTSTTTAFRPGDTITFMVEVSNEGCACLGRFEVEDNLTGEGYLTYVDGSARLFVNGSMREIVPTNLAPLTFSFQDNLERGASLILQYNAVVSENINADVSEITNEVCVHAYPCGCSCNDNSRNTNCVHACDTLTIPRATFAEILITKAVSNPNVCCGEELDYDITLTNIGNIDATEVVITDEMPTGFTATEIRMENNGEVYVFNASEYTIDSNNVLTLPNATGRAILIPAIAPGVDNTTRIRIHGTM